MLPARWGGPKYILTDPALCSIREEFGCTDCGLNAQLLFLSHHTCGLLCAHWQHTRLSMWQRVLESVRLFSPGIEFLF